MRFFMSSWVVFSIFSALTREESRNIVAMYNPRSLEQLKADYPNIDWSRYFVETMDIDTPQEFILTEPKGMKQADDSRFSQ